MVSLKGWLPNKNDFALAAGAATSGTITGYIQGMLPVNLEFLPGMTEFIIGVGAQKFLFKKGMAKQFFKGVAIAGLSHMIASFIPQFAGTIGKPVQGTMQTQQNGAYHAQWFAQKGPGLYVHRNPLFGTHTETLVAPKGTTHLKGRVPRIDMAGV